MASESEKIPVSKGVRGPSYPSMSLEEAIGKAMQFWTAEKRNAAPVEVAARNWGYSPSSSSGKVVTAALLHFGLLEDSGAGATRTVKLTGRALDILLDEVSDSPRRIQALQDAVREPRIYTDVLNKWPPSELPSDQTLRFYLLREKSFNEGAISAFIKDFRASLAYAKLDKTPTIDSPLQGNTAVNTDSEVLEDFVKEEKSVNHAYADAVAQQVSVRQTPPVSIGSGLRQDTFSLDEGQVVLQFPEKMSSDSFEDFQSWIELQLRKIKRSIQT
jgi:hypothetical protein